MSFGGGGSSSTGVTNHVHDDSAGEGGSLKMQNGAATTTFDIGVGANQNLPLEVLL